MNILQINKFHFPKGGSETVYLGVIKLLADNLHNVVPFSMKDPRNESSEFDKYFIENVSFENTTFAQQLSAAFKTIYSFDAREKMSALLREFKPDIAHFHIFQHQISPSVFGPLRKCGIPIVLTLHDLKPICPNYKMLTHDGTCERCKGRKFYNCLVHRCSKGSALKSLVNCIEMYVHYAIGYYQMVDKFISPSNFYRDKMIEFGFPEAKVVHIPNFLDTSRITLSDADSGYGLYFGRFSGEKGIMTLLQALASSPDLPFYLVGSGPLDHVMRERVEIDSLSNVKVLGFKSGEELQELIAGSSFTVIPSEWYENCPMSALESLAVGKPVIGARIGGIPELVREGVDGLLFESGNADDLAEKMNIMWNNKAKRKQMGRTGRNKIENYYTPKNHYEKTMEVYNSVVNKNM